MGESPLAYPPRRLQHQSPHAELNSTHRAIDRFIVRHYVALPFSPGKRSRIKILGGEQLAEDYQMNIPIQPNADIVTAFIDLDTQGKLTLVVRPIPDETRRRHGLAFY